MISADDPVNPFARCANSWNVTSSDESKTLGSDARRRESRTLRARGLHERPLDRHGTGERPSASTTGNIGHSTPRINKDREEAPHRMGFDTRAAHPRGPSSRNRPAAEAGLPMAGANRIAGLNPCNEESRLKYANVPCSLLRHLNP